MPYYRFEEHHEATLLPQHLGHAMGDSCMPTLLPEEECMMCEQPSFSQSQ